jgi:protein tyrosine phosphatase (PTP) superfamily phosphohydrolase (DUF442 family)
MRWLLVLLPLLMCGCSRKEDAGPPSPTPSEPVRLSLDGLHNVYRVSERLYSGSSPEGAEGFRSLQRLGIKMVLSVDGARPDVDRARRHGLRYVHLPIGYHGISEEQVLRLARAVRDLPGPIYVHCHHGKHRGPAAAAVALLCLDESWGNEEAVAWLHQAGTDSRYTGLYAAVRTVRPAMKVDLDGVPPDFAEVAEVGGLARLMVAIDEHWEHLRLVRKAGWKVPLGHPDVDPPHEALQLAELYREAGRLPLAKRAKGKEFRRWLVEAEQGALKLERILRPGKGKQNLDVEATEKAFRQAAAACTRCHTRYRDAPPVGRMGSPPS